jgi:hypothetical protein
MTRTMVLRECLPPLANNGWIATAIEKPAAMLFQIVIYPPIRPDTGDPEAPLFRKLRVPPLETHRTQ